MITEKEYLQAKSICDKYENDEFIRGMEDVMYCTTCQAIDSHDCYCDEDDEDEDCHVCCGTGGNHHIQCEYNTNPYDNLLRDGYD